MISQNQELQKVNLDEQQHTQETKENKLEQNNTINTNNNTINTNNKCLINHQCNRNALNLSENICIVDLSYMTFTRFFAVRKWYEIKMKTDKPEWKIPDDYDWTSDNLFMSKFNKLFFEKLFTLCKKNNIPISNVLFTVDCKHNKNWRVISKSEYKETRKDSHERNRFHNFNIFPHVRNELIRELQEETGNIVLQDENLEADDIVAITVDYLTSKPEFNSKIIIMANDKDYVQICNNMVNCCDLNGKSLSERILSGFSNAKEYLIYKILFGDISDNLLPCYFSKGFLKQAKINTKKDYLKATDNNIKKIFKQVDCYNLLNEYLEYSRDLNIMLDEELKDKWFNKLEIFNIITKDKQFEHNARLIDFKNIPNDYKSRVITLLQNII